MKMKYLVNSVSCWFLQQCSE